MKWEILPDVCRTSCVCVSECQAVPMNATIKHCYNASSKTHTFLQNVCKYMGPFPHIKYRPSHIVNEIAMQTIIYLSIEKSMRKEEYNNDRDVGIIESMFVCGFFFGRLKITYFRLLPLSRWDNNLCSSVAKRPNTTYNHKSHTRKLRV